MVSGEKNPSRLRILHLSGRPQWCGESNRVLVECAGLRARGHEVLLGTSPASALVERARERGVPVDARFRFTKGFRPQNTWHDVRALRALLAERRFDLVHLHTPRDTWPAALALGPRGKQDRPLLVRTKHHSLPTHANLVHRWLYGQRIDHLILAGEKLRETVSELIAAGAPGPERIHILHSSIDTTRFDPARVDGRKVRAEFGLQDRFVIGLVGRLSVEKGHAVLLDVLEKLLPAHPDLAVLFAGEGDQMDALKARVAASPLLAKAVIFTGARRDIPDIVAAFDVQVAPSLWLEASPAVVKEAMALHVPVVATDVGGVTEIVTDGRDGLVVPPGDAAALQAALEKLIADPDLRKRLGEAGRARIVAAFSDDRLVEDSITLYRSMLKGAP